MRHSDPRLTANIYTDTTLLPTFEAVQGLPWLSQNPPKWTVKGTPKPVFKGQNVSSIGTNSEEQCNSEIVDFEDVRQELSQIDKDLKLAERGGFEAKTKILQPTGCKNDRNLSHKLGALNRTHTTFKECPILTQVIKKWDSLSEDTKKAIGAIVGM